MVRRERDRIVYCQSTHLRGGSRVEVLYDDADEETKKVETFMTNEVVPSLNDVLPREQVDALVRDPRDPRDPREGRRAKTTDDGPR